MATESWKNMQSSLPRSAVRAMSASSFIERSVSQTASGWRHPVGWQPGTLKKAPKRNWRLAFVMGTPSCELPINHALSVPRNLPSSPALHCGILVRIEEQRSMPLLTTRAFLKSAVALGVGARSAAAQTWPTRPLRLVVPFSAGAGILDIMARLLSQRLSAALGQQVVVDNKPGAGGNVGSEIAAKAAPDGYTLLIAGPALVVSTYLYAHLDFDPLNDFTGVTMINSAPLLLVVHPSLPVKSVAELIAYAKASPGKLNYGSGGVGSTPYLG